LPKTLFQFIAMFRFVFFTFMLGSGLLLSSCASSQLPNTQQPSWQSLVATSPVFKQNHTGFALYDIEKKSIVADYQSDRYFTTASNVKLYSFYAGLCMLGDSVPALKYTSRNDSLFFCGTGDPTLLHPDMPSSKVLSFLKNWNGKLFWYEPVYQGK
jgi:serine-type D-Ala-D-Ala carboxypeptidase/endopeptidase (penicillin-binding protein 4)